MISGPLSYRVFRETGPRTANDPQIGPQMVPDRKWSPYWTPNDPDQKIRNGMDGRIGWIGNWCIWIPIFFSLCLNARQLGKVLNGLNARPKKFSQNFHWKIISNFLMIFDVSRKVVRFQKLCSFVRRRNSRACAYYEIGICLTLRKFTLASAVRDIYRIATKSFWRCDVCLE